VQASNIQDKDVILRVLSMYKDPEEREQQIRNMSEGFRELADGILPELRRSRLIINYETIGRSDDEIKAQYQKDATKLSADELLYLATLEDNNAEKENVYKAAANYYDKDYRAYNNLAVLAFNQGDDATAKSYIQQAFEKKADAPEANANLGMMALKNGNLQEAENYIAKATDANGVNQALGNLNIAKGNYAQAEENFKDSYNNSAALAQILNKDYAAAKATLNNIKNPDGLTSYLHAIASARQGNKYAATSYLKEALQKDPSLSNYAGNDLEFEAAK
jgi:Flp pilus assembly protein TadD